jgi:hypothetical protein
MLKKSSSFVLARQNRLTKTLGAHGTLPAHEDTAASPTRRHPQT